jgi:formate dehydrogenase maturation protein FdhE
MNIWEQCEMRALRARFLARSFPVSREILTFYAGVAEWQRDVAPQISAFNKLPALLPSLLDLVSRTAPAPLAQAAREFDLAETESWLRLYWDFPGDVSPHEFLARAVLQPYAATLPEGLDCPWCAHAPQAGCLRPQGDGLAFELVCPLCLRRRSFPRTRCAGCNEVSESNLATFATDNLPHLRLLACETCKAYLVIVDLAKDVAAIPEVDEMAALPLDLWAVEQGYHKLQPNLAGV